MAGVQAVSEAIGARLPLILPTFAILAVVLVLQHVTSRSSLTHIPVVGQELGGDEKRRVAYLTRALDLYGEGYKKVSVRPYSLAPLRRSFI